MTFAREVKNGVVMVKLDGDLTVYEAAAIHDELLECLDAHAGLTLDLTDVNECDVTGVQLLYSAGLAADMEKKSFAIQGATAGVTEMIAQTGLDPGTILRMAA